MKDKVKRFGVPKIDRLFVPVPHELVLDHRVSSSAQRLWEGLHICAWHKFPPDPDRLAELMQTTRRSVFRWLAELEEYRWMERFRSLDSEERYLLKTSVDEAQDSLTLAKIRAALDGGATLGDIRSARVRPHASAPVGARLRTYAIVYEHWLRLDHALGTDD